MYQKQEATCLNSTIKTIEILQGNVLITNHPINRLIDLNSQATFTVNALGSVSLAYQWQEKVGNTFTNLTNTAPYSGVNTSTLAIASVSMLYNNRQYRCLITDCGTAFNTNTVTLEVNPNALPNNVLNESITFYPNPTKDKVWITTLHNKASVIEILSADGKTIQTITPQKVNNTQYELSLAKLDKGAYLIKIWVGKEFVIKRFIKE
jgi:hypothetical protein